MELKISDKKIPIEDQYNIIIGKFEDTFEDLKNKNSVFRNFNQFSSLSIRELLLFIIDNEEKYNEFEELFKLIDILENYQDKIFHNITLLNQTNDLISEIESDINYFELNKKKNELEHKLELSLLKSKSSKISAKTDLIDKLKKRISNNRNRLEYLKEDYLKYKNQVEQINIRIDNLKLSIKELNRQKKKSFKQINKITRDMESNQSGKKDKLAVKSGTLTNAEKIQKLRREAKESHYKINEIKTKIRESSNKLNEVMPRFSEIKEDYENLEEAITRDQEQINKIKLELQEELNNSKELESLDSKFEDFDSIKSPETLKNQLNELKNRLKYIKSSSPDLGKNENKNYANLKEKTKNLIDQIDKKKERYLFQFNEEEYSPSIEEYREFELFLRRIEQNLNYFLDEINLHTDFSLNLSKNEKDFILKSNFIRNKKENILFGDLTTPEKVFFVTMFYITLKLQIKKNTIIFSNLFINDDFNKRGSIFRTIRKSLPILKEKFGMYSFIFIISNLEIKKPIKDVKIIRI
ncbi:MAG: hypothetical protein GF317_22420 [Candidatus Lokiarchaeota archaeon]|nr:hypothetical protein [Candidatus Lokiarchaeota archaeon]MBD3202216.1 hypothetical protein [Candidatus Lokiarchaeota archaeon]